MQIYKVGGAVRDRLLGQPQADVDWVVVGATAQQMQDLGFRAVGSDFPVFLHPKTGEEYALARTERKSEVTLEEDLKRRDLTINALAEDQNGQIIDPWGGKQDLADRVLRHVSPAFAEDPLRVLRVARFAARYAPLGFVVADETLELMRQLSQSGELEHLSAERLWKEISRALMEPRPDVFIRLLRECAALAVLLPEVNALFGVPQPPKHHPEVDTGEHVLAVLHQCALHNQPLSVRWCCLLHDLGKAITPPEAWPKHHGHEQLGLNPVTAVNQRLKIPRDLAELALLCCEYHSHAHRALELRPQTLLELFQRFDLFRRPQRLTDFIAACEMDSRGRTGFENRPYPQADYLHGAARAVQVVSVKPLLERGFTGEKLGLELNRARLHALKHYQQEQLFKI